MVNTDLDKSIDGSKRAAPSYLGPTLGYTDGQQNILQVTTGGTTTIDRNVTMVEVNYAGPVTIQLPSTITMVTALGTLVRPMVSVVDTSGAASVNNITILPYGSELIMGLASVTIDANWGSFVLTPLAAGGWVLVSFSGFGTEGREQVMAPERRVYVGSEPATITSITAATPGVVNWTNHGLVANDPVAFGIPANLVAITSLSIATPSVIDVTANGFAVNQPFKILSPGTTLPSGVTGETPYYVKTILTADTFTYSLTPGGAAINTTGAQSGTHLLERLGDLPTGLTKGTIYYVKTVLDPNSFTISATPGGAAINTTGSASTGIVTAWTGNDTTADGTTLLPFMTLQAAWDWAQSNLDSRGYYIQIRCRGNHYKVDGYVLIASGVMAQQRGNNFAMVLGDLTNQTNCVLEATLTCVAVYEYANILLQGFRLTGNVGFSSLIHSAVVYSLIDFATCTTAHYQTDKISYNFDAGQIQVSGGAAFHGITGSNSYSTETTGQTVFLTPVSIGTYAFVHTNSVLIQHTNKTYIGAVVTGQRMDVRYGGIISAETLTTLPGSTQGTVDEYSLFLSGDLADTTSLYPAWTGYTPVVSAPGGSVTSTCTGQYKVDKQTRTMTVRGELVITANTATNWLNVTLPGILAPVNSGAGAATWGLAGAGILAGIINGGVGVLNITARDGTVPTGTGTIFFTVTYEV